MSKALSGVLTVLAVGLACDEAALQPGGAGGAGTTGRAGMVGTGGATAGSGGATISPPTCPSISTEIRHFNPCGRTTSLAYSPDGRLLVAGMDAQRPNVHVWRLSDGALVRDIDGIGGVTYQVAFSPDGTLLATAGGYPDSGALSGLPEIVKLWNVADGSLARTIPAHCGFYADAVAFSHDGTLLVTAGSLGPVELWRVADGAMVASISNPTSVHNAHFSPDDTKVIVGSVDGRATVWSVPAAGLMMTLDGIADEMADAAFSPDGREIATTGTNNAVVLWHGTTGAVLQMLPGHAEYVSHVVWAGTDRLVSNDWGGTVKTWTRTDGEFRQSAELRLSGQSLGLAIAPDQQTAAVGGADPTGIEGFVIYRP